MHFTIRVINGLTMEQCLENASNISLKLEPYYFDDANERYPTFILGFGGISNEDLSNHVQALISALVINDYE